MNFVKVRVQLSWWDPASPWITLAFTDALSVETDDVVEAANYVSGPRGPTVNTIDFTESIPSPTGGGGPIDEEYVFAIPPGLFPTELPITGKVMFINQETYGLADVTISFSENGTDFAVAGTGVAGDDIPLTVTETVSSFWTDFNGTRERDV